MGSTQDVDLEFTRRLPKIELHAHLSGSISRQCLHEVWLQKKAAEPGLALEDPLTAIPLGKVDYDLHTFFPLFSSYIYNLITDIPSITYTTHSVLHSFQSDNVTHLELRTTPRAIPSTNIITAQYIDTVLSCISAHNNAVFQSSLSTPMHTTLILSVDRRNTLDQALHVADLAISRRHLGVVGLDLGGDPSVGPISHLAPAFAKARAAGLKLTLHFAEAPASASDGELWELLSWRPDRVGHAICVGEEVRREIVSRGVGVEICLSCNVLAGMSEEGFEGHHFGWWRGAGVGIALSTDDVGVFCSPLSQEYWLAAHHFGLSRADVRKLCEGAVGVIFGDEVEKQRLRGLYASWEGWTA